MAAGVCTTKPRLTMWLFDGRDDILQWFSGPAGMYTKRDLVKKHCLNIYLSIITGICHYVIDTGQTFQPYEKKPYFFSRP